MIIGISVDVVELKRIEKIWNQYGIKFANKILSEQEQKLLPQTNPVTFLAGRFAAKEALSKALGTGFSAQVNFKNFSVCNLPSGQPVAELSGAALQTMQKNGAKQVFISISHDKGCAVAMAILEA